MSNATFEVGDLVVVKDSLHALLCKYTDPIDLAKVKFWVICAKIEKRNGYCYALAEPAFPDTEQHTRFYSDSLVAKGEVKAYSMNYIIEKLTQVVSTEVV